MMRGRSLIVLAVVVAVVAAYIFLFERHQATTEQALEQAEKVFPDFDQESVAKVEITTAENSFQLSKSNGHWRLEQPISYPADDGAVGSLLRTLAGLKAERRLTEDEVDRAAYGLDTPSTTVVISTAEGSRHELAVGDETPLGQNRAVTTDQPGVILCAGWFTSELEKTLDEWRSHDVVEVYAGDLAAVEVIADGDRVHAVRIDEDWKLLQPMEDLADREHLQNLISDLNSLEVTTFLDEGDPAAFGLDSPGYHLTVLRTEGREPITLAFGDTREDGGTTQVACLRDGHDLFWVDDSVRTRLAKAPVLWRSAIVYPFDTWNVERMAVTTAGSTVVSDRSDGLWRLADGAEADYTEVQKRLSSLAELKAAGYDLIAPTAAADSTVELTFKGEGQATTVSFSFYPPMAAGGRSLVTVSHRDTVMSVEPADTSGILENLDSLRKPVEAEEAPPLTEQP